MVPFFDSENLLWIGTRIIFVIQMKGKVFRPRLNHRELKLLVVLVDKRYRTLRRSITEERKKIKNGWSDDWLYPHAEKVRDIKDLKRLLKKLNRLLTGEYTINPTSTRDYRSLERVKGKFMDYREKLKKVAKEFAVAGINPLVWWGAFGDKPLGEATCEDCKLFKAELCQREQKIPLDCMRAKSTALLMKYSNKYKGEGRSIY